MAHVVQLKRSATTTAAPTAGQLSAGELAINTVDETIFFKNSSGTVKKLSAMSDLTSNMVLLTGAQTVAGVKTFSSNILLTGTGIDTVSASTFYIANQSTILTIGSNATTAAIGAMGGTSTFRMGDFNLYRTLSKSLDTLYVYLAAADVGIYSMGTLGVGVPEGPLTLGDWEGGGNNSTVVIDDATQLVTSNIPISVSSTTVSTSSTTGALIVAGGVGIAKDSFINGMIIGTRGTASCTAVGASALLSSTAANCTAVGDRAASGNSATNLTAVGLQAAQGNNGTQCTAVGVQALLSNTQANCTAIGSASLTSNTGSSCTAVGFFSGYENTGANVVAVGVNALRANVAAGNTAIGNNALYPAIASQPSGINNTAGGLQSLDACTSGTLNSAWGADSLGALTTGASNVGIGSTAGSNLTTGSNNTIIGAAATVSAVGDSNSIVIGKSAVGLGTNTTVIGVSTTTSTKIFGTLTLDDTALISSSSATAKAIKSTVPAGTGVTPTVQIICPSAAYTLLNQTATQKVFNLPQDTITLQASTTYMFDGQYLINSGTTSHSTSMSFVLTTATMTNCTWITNVSSPAALNATAAGISTAIFNSVTGGTLNSANVQPYIIIRFQGVMRVNAAGTLVPNIAFSAAPGGTNTTMIGSYLKFYPIGSNTIDFVGSAIG